MNILTCSREFRDILLEEYPGLVEFPIDDIDKGNWRHLFTNTSLSNGVYVDEVFIYFIKD